MAERSNSWKLVKELSHGAEQQGLTEFDVHGMVRDAFREVHEQHVRRLETAWDVTFRRLRKRQAIQARIHHVQQQGGDSMTKPLKEFSSGSVRAAIWENNRDDGTDAFITHTVRVERRYKDQDGEWQGTNGFRKNDLASVELVVRKAFEFLTMRERDPQDEENGESPEA